MANEALTNQQILQKAIEKAQANGWEVVYPYNQPMHYGIGAATHRVFFGDCAEATMLLFDHGFAKALWGDSLIGEEVSTTYADPSHPKWMYHLQHMVIADDPIAYLGEHLDD